MVKLKQMPDNRKYNYVLKSMVRCHTYIPAFLQKHLGDQAIAELKDIWHEGFRQIPQYASVDVKYEIAYSNWIWLAKSTYSFIRGQLGEDGVRQFERAEVEELKQQNSGVAMVILQLVRELSPTSAFMMLAKQLSYQLQWFTPIDVSEFTPYRLVVHIPRCKILDFTDTDEVCLIGCQSTYSIWLAEQFQTRLQTERHGNSCIKTLVPLLTSPKKWSQFLPHYRS
jgi:hypothetical protein